MNGFQKLIKPINDDNDKILYYVKNEELFEVLLNIHSTIGHEERNRMEYECKNIYCNVTRVCIMEFLKLCVVCQKKSSGAQGYEKCNCKTGCAQNKCKCLKNNRKCNSRCHSSLSCKNK